MCAVFVVWPRADAVHAGRDVDDHPVVPVRVGVRPGGHVRGEPAAAAAAHHQAQPAAASVRGSLLDQPGVGAADQAAADDGAPLNEDGLTQNHIKMVMDHTSCTRNQAIKALRETNDDMVQAVMKLTDQ